MASTNMRKRPQRYQSAPYDDRGHNTISSGITAPLPPYQSASFTAGVVNNNNNTQSIHYEGKYDKCAPTEYKKSTSNNVVHLAGVVISLLVLIAPWFHHSSLSYTASKLNEKIESLQLQQKSLTETLDKDLVEYVRLQTNMKKLDEENAAIIYDFVDTVKAKQDNKNDSASLDSIDIDNIIENGDEDSSSTLAKLVVDEENGMYDEEAYQQRIRHIEQDIQRAARLNMIHRYGKESIHNLRVIVTLQDDVLHGTIVRELSKNIKGDRFTIDMGPPDSYPHAVDTFLQLATIEHYYDGLTLIYRESSKAIQTIPRIYETGVFLNEQDIPSEDDEDTNNVKRTVAFREHSSKYQMKKYSVCFTTNGGPHFYIHLDDDESHHTVTDSCFARIRDGRAVLEYIIRDHEQQAKLNNKKEKLYMLGIKSIRLDPRSIQSSSN